MTAAGVGIFALTVVVALWFAASCSFVGRARSWCRSVLAALRKCSELHGLLEKLVHHMERSASASDACATNLEAVRRGVQEVRCMVSMKCDELLSRVDASGRESGDGTAQLVRQLESCVRELVRLQEVSIRESARLGERFESTIADHTDEVLMLAEEIKDGVVGLRRASRAAASPGV